MLKSKILLRIAAGCMLFFALGHAMGHFTRHETTDPAKKELLQKMIESQFDMFGQMRSLDQNYEGMSLNLIFTLVTFALILWGISDTTDRKLVIKIVLPMSIWTLGFAITSFLFFFPVPAVTCVIATLAMWISVVKVDKTSVVLSV